MHFSSLIEEISFGYPRSDTCLSPTRLPSWLLRQDLLATPLFGLHARSTTALASPKAITLFFASDLADNSLSLLTFGPVVIFGGAFLGFALARLQFLDFNGVYCNGQAAPGECYWYTNFPKYKVGIILHLSSILRKSI